MSGGEDQRLQPRLDAKLVQDVDHVGANGFGADVEALTDFTVSHPLGQGREDFSLARCKLGDRLLCGSVALSLLASQPEQNDRFFEVEKLLTGAQPADRVDNLGERR